MKYRTILLEATYMGKSYKTLTLLVSGLYSSPLAILSSRKHLALTLTTESQLVRNFEFSEWYQGFERYKRPLKV